MIIGVQEGYLIKTSCGSVRDGEEGRVCVNKKYGPRMKRHGRGRR